MNVAQQFLRRRRYLPLIGSLLITTASLAGTRARADAPNTPAAAILTEGTPINVELAGNTYSNNMGMGDPVMFKVVDPVYSTDGTHTLVIAPGSIAMGRVIVKSREFHGNVAGRLNMTCEYALGVSGKVWIRDTAASTGAVKTPIQARHTGGGAEWEKAIMHRSVGFANGQQFTVYVDQDAKTPALPVPVTQDAASAPGSAAK